MKGGKKKGLYEKENKRNHYERGIVNRITYTPPRKRVVWGDFILKYMSERKFLERQLSGHHGNLMNSC
jgi:hypothetical protein